MASPDSSNGVLASEFGNASNPVTEAQMERINATVANQYRKNAGTNELVPVGRPVIADGMVAVSYAIKVFDGGQSRFQASLVEEDASKGEVSSAMTRTWDFIDKVKGRTEPPMNDGGGD